MRVKELPCHFLDMRVKELPCHFLDMRVKELPCHFLDMRVKELTLKKFLAKKLWCSQIMVELWSKHFDVRCK